MSVERTKIAITGSIAFDYIMSYPGEFKEMLLADNLENISVSFLVDDMTRHRGGVAANVAYSLALLGERPLLVGAAGCDFDEFRIALEQAGVDTSGVQVHADLYTASFFVSTDRRHGQIASFYSGAMARAKDLSLSQWLRRNLDYVLVSPNDPAAMQNHIAECRSNGTPYIYDPSQQVARSDEEGLSDGIDGAYLVIVNEYEFGALCGKTGLTLDGILKKANNLIITRGSKGADIFTRDEEIHIPIATAIRITDPTGVGDAFRAGLIKGILSGWNWDISGRLGAVAAAYALEQQGTQNHIFSRNEFVERFRRHFDDNGVLDEMLTS